MKSIFIFFILSFYFLSCGTSDKNSARDSKREQQRNYNLLKKNELSKIEGTYTGELENRSNKQKIALKITVKEEINQSDSEVDSLLTPRISGYMLLSALSNQKSESYVSYEIIKGEYDQKLNSLAIELNNSKYGALNLKLQVNKNELKGSWLANSNSLMGLVSLNQSEKDIDSLYLSSQTSLNSKYQGWMIKKKTKEYHHSQLIFQSKKEGTDSLSLSATLTIYSGEKSLQEYQIFTFSKISLNVLTGTLSMLDDTSSVSLNGDLNSLNIRGEWHSSTLGTLGSFKLSKNEKQLPEQHKLSIGIVGQYSGHVLNIDAKTNLFDNISLAINTTRNQDSSNGIKISGSIRLYIGLEDSHEYMDYILEDLHFNFFTREISAQLAGSTMTIEGRIEGYLFSGNLYDGGLGQIGTIEVNRDEN